MTPPDLPRLPPRDPESHKGNFGRVLVVAGSRGMSGAAVLTGSAAVRGGAGLVRVACPADIQPVVAAGNPCYMTAPLPLGPDGHLSDRAGADLDWLAAGADVLAVGPGLGNRSETQRLVAHLLGAAADMPAVVDADALNVLADDLSPLARPGPTIVTPHPKEFARLTRADAPPAPADREPAARAFAAEYRVVVLLKGRNTVVTDGTRTFVNSTGNPGLATGGSGDVLTGLVAALVGQGLSGYDAAALGAWLHGRAGDLAAADLTPPCVTAADLIGYLPKAFREVAGG